MENEDFKSLLKRWENSDNLNHAKEELQREKQIFEQHKTNFYLEQLIRLKNFELNKKC